MFYAEDKPPAAPRDARRRAARGPLPLRLRGHEGRRSVADGACTTRDVPVAILAGGLATRLRPMTERSRRRWSTSPAGRSSTTSSPCCARTASAASCSASGTWASRSRPSSATARLGPARRLLLRRRRAARHRRRAPARAAAAGRGVLGHLRRLVSGHRLRGGAREPSSAAAPGR